MLIGESSAGPSNTRQSGEGKNLNKKILLKLKYSNNYYVKKIYPF